MNTYKKKSGREIRTAKYASATEAIGRIEHNTDTFVLTFGQFSLIDALMVILDQTGPADVSISTWTAADAHLEKAISLIESSQIKTFRMIVDRSFETRQPGYCFHMRRLFGDECIRHIRSHAKFMLIRNESWNIVVRTSMNLNENPRLENIEISEDLGFAEYFQEVVDDIFQTVSVGEKKSQMLGLNGINDVESPYKEVDATQIKRIDLNEPGYTHTIKKL